jgi:hypothetical protein
MEPARPFPAASAGSAYELRLRPPRRVRADRRRALVKGLCLAIAALTTVQPGEVVEVGGDGRMVWSECLLIDGERKRLWLAIAALRNL